MKQAASIQRCAGTAWSRLQRFTGTALLSCLLCGGTLAFEMDAGTFANNMALQPMRERLEKSHQTIFGTSVEESLRLASASPQGHALAPPTGFRAAVLNPSTAQRLAAAYPPAARTQAARTFAELLAGFRQIESQLGLPAGDVANAVAAFLSGSVWALHGSEVPDAHFLALVQQMRQSLARTPAIVQAGSRNRQETYEELAILGMLMATTQMALARQPDAAAAARAREAAAAYLESFLRTSPERVRITAAGLVIR